MKTRIFAYNFNWCWIHCKISESNLSWLIDFTIYYKTGEKPLNFQLIPTKTSRVKGIKRYINIWKH